MTESIDSLFANLTMLVNKIKTDCYYYYRFYEIANETTPLYIIIDTDVVLKDYREPPTRSTPLGNKFLQAVAYLKHTGIQVIGLSRKTTRRLKKREAKVFTKMFYCSYVSTKVNAIKKTLQLAPVGRRLIFFGEDIVMHDCLFRPRVDVFALDLLIDITDNMFNTDPNYNGHNLLESILLYISILKSIQALREDF
jgi:hypothetical protein